MKTVPSLLSLLLLGALWSPSLGPARAAEPKSDKPAGASLDDELLKGLGGLPEDEHLEKRRGRTAKKAADKPARSKPGARPARKGDLDDELLKGLEDGEDVSLGDHSDGGEASGDEDNPFAQLERQMRDVESRIADANSDRTTQRMQDKIVHDLAEIIKKLKQQKKSSSSSSSSSQQNQETAEREKVEQPEEGQASGDETPSNSPAKDSSSAVSQRKAERPDGAPLEEALKDIWGQLPDHLRQQMEQYAKEELLPQYELQIEEYFRALARGQRERP